MTVDQYKETRNLGMYIRILNVQHEVDPRVLIIFINNGEEAVTLDA